MATFVLVPGAGGMAWYWYRMVPLIRAAGHEAIAVDLPGGDRRAGLAAYADIVIRAIAERTDVVLVAQSLAGFTAPLVCARTPMRMIVFRERDDPETGRDARCVVGSDRSRRSSRKRCSPPPMRRNSICRHTSCMTCLRKCCAPVRNSLARKPRPFSPSHVVSRACPISPFMSWRERTTAFFQSNFNDASRVKGSGSRWSESPVNTSSRCRS